MAFDSEHRLVLGVIFGKRSSTRILTLLKRVKQQLQDRVPRLVTSDQYASYQTVLQQIWPRTSPPRQDKRCKRRTRCVAPTPAPDPSLNYATVCKNYLNGRVQSVHTQVVFGSRKSVNAALRQSCASTTINTSFLERHNATDRHRNARKQRRTYRFSKDWQVHQAVGYFSYYSYNFCWCVRTLTQKATQAGDKQQPQTPAMAAGLTDHPWSLDEWLARPVPILTS